MTVLFVTPDPGRGGGVATSARRILTSLQHRRMSVRRIRPDGGCFPGELMDSDEEWLHGPAPLHRTVDHIVDAARRCNASVIVGFYGGQSGQAAVAAAGIVGAASLLALRGNDLDHDFLDPTRHALVRWAIDRATAVCTVSTEAASKVEAWTGRTATVVGNGVDTSRFQPVDAERFRKGNGLTRKTVGMFGEFKPKRGLEALAGFPHAGWDVLLVGHVRESVAHLVPSGAVHLDWVEPEQLNAAYCAVDVVLQPSWHDGLPNVVLEAMAAGRTVLGRPVGGIADVIEHGVNGYLSESDWIEAAEHARTHPLDGRSSVPTLAQEADRWMALLTGLSERRVDGLQSPGLR